MTLSRIIVLRNLALVAAGGGVYGTPGLRRGVIAAGTSRICVVRKLGVLGQPQAAMGVIASGGVQVLNESVV